MTGTRRVFQLLAWTSLLALTTACSTVRPVRNERLGFFDRVARSEGVKRSPAYSTPPASVNAAKELAAPAAAAREVNEVELTASERKSVHFSWPLKRVSVTSSFGQRGQSFHEGVDLRAETGTPVLAVDSGTVLYADKRISGYGKMVVIRHANSLATVYAHNSRLLVRRGQRVARGQKIALSGSSGHATGPHLHFEVRKGVSAVDPLLVLPKAPLLTKATPVAAPKAHVARSKVKRSVAVASKKAPVKTGQKIKRKKRGPLRTLASANERNKTTVR